MRTITLFVLTILAVVTASSQDRSAENEVLAFMSDYDTVSKTQDWAAMGQMLAPDYTYTNPYGQGVSRSALLELVRLEKSGSFFRIDALKSENVAVRIYGDVALVTLDWSLDTTSKDARAGEPPHRDKGRKTAVLAKRDGRWLLLHEHDSEQQHDKSLMEKQVALLGRAYTEMIKRNDAASITTILADDYLVTDEEGTVLTKQQDLATYKDRAKSVKIETVEYKDQKVRMLTGSVAVEHSTIRFTGAKNGKPFDITERITTTWQFRDGRWLIVADHFSYVKPR